MPEWSPDNAFRAVEMEREAFPEESHVELAQRLMSETADAITSGPHIQPGDPRYTSYIRLREFIERTKGGEEQ